MSAPAELLRRVSMFSGLDQKELEQIGRAMKARTFAAGQEVAREGEAGVGFFVIEDGEATVTIRGSEVGRLAAGDSFGEIALLAESERTATVVADSELRCWGMTVWDFRPLVEENAGIAWKIIQSLAQRLRAAEQRES